MSIRFSHDHVGISVTPEDLDATIEWYATRLGFRVDQRFESHGTTFVYLVAGHVKIELVAGASNRQAPTGDILTSMDPPGCTTSASPSTTSTRPSPTCATTAWG